MDTVKILRQLWHFRLLVALIALLAVVAGFAVSFKLGFPLESRKYTVGVATARILVDTPNSQVVEVAPAGSDAVGGRATLLANLMVDGEIKAAIAKRAGLKPEQLIGVGETATAPDSAAVTPTKNSYVLTTEVLTVPNGGWLPIIEVSTQAPDAARAKRLADAAVGGLTGFLDSKAAADAVPDADRLRVGPLGVAQAREETRGPRLLFSLIAMVFVFVAGCATTLGVASVVRGLRAGEAPESPSPSHVTDDEWARVEAQDAWSANLPEPELIPSRSPVTRAEADIDSASEVSPAAPPARGTSAWWGGGPESS